MLSKLHVQNAVTLTIVIEAPYNIDLAYSML